jgi:hypothetical protein
MAMMFLIVDYGEDANPFLRAAGRTIVGVSPRMSGNDE